MTTTNSAAAHSSSLSFLEPCELDHFDIASPFTIRSGQLWGVLTRRLFAYGYEAASANGATPGVPIPDVALETPTVTNGGLSDDGRTCRLHLRRGIFWDAQGARELVAGDIVRGLKRVAHDTATARRYFTDTIVGMQEYCDAYDAVLGGWPANAPDFAQFHFANHIEGVRATDPHTVEIELTAPANDLLQILATGIAAAAPREYDYFVPNSYELVRNSPSAGPYRISRTRSHELDLVLERNPRWDPRTDPVRRPPAHEIRVGPANGDGRNFDAAWTFGRESWMATTTRPPGYGLGPYLAVNLREPRSGRPTNQPALRQAIAVAVDRAAIYDIVASAGVPGMTALVQHTLLPPGIPGYVASSPHAEPDCGDPARARQILASMGLADKPIVSLAMRDTDSDWRVATVLRANLADCGIALNVRCLPGNRLSDELRTEGANWDLALTSWKPDWYGNNGRTACEPLLRGGARPGAANYGGYDNPTVDRLLTGALQASPEHADDLWRQVDAAVMLDLPIIPILAHVCGPCSAATGAAPHVGWSPPV